MDKTLAPQKTSSPSVTECSPSSFSFARHFRRQVSARRVYLLLAGGYPYEESFAAVYRALRPPGLATV